MHSIRARLAAKRPELSKVPFWSTVIFPYVEFSIESEEWHGWQVIDNRRFRSGSIGKLLSNVLDNARRFLRSKASARWFKPRVVRAGHSAMRNDS